MTLIGKRTKRLFVFAIAVAFIFLMMPFVAKAAEIKPDPDKFYVVISTESVEPITDDSATSEETILRFSNFGEGAGVSWDSINIDNEQKTVMFENLVVTGQEMYFGPAADEYTFIFAGENSVPCLGCVAYDETTWEAIPIAITFDLSDEDSKLTITGIQYAPQEPTWYFTDFDEVTLNLTDDVTAVPSDYKAVTSGTIVFQSSAVDPTEPETPTTPDSTDTNEQSNTAGQAYNTAADASKNATPATGDYMNSYIIIAIIGAGAVATAVTVKKMSKAND